MGKTSIEWATMSWNPIRGCTRVSPGCVNCYAEVMAARFSDPGLWGHGVAEMVTIPMGFARDGKGIDHRWTGKIIEVPEKLAEPLHWRKPQRIFVNSTSDLFHEGVSERFIAEVFAIAALCPQHTFLILTKRADRMRKVLETFSQQDGYSHLTQFLIDTGKEHKRKWEGAMSVWPLPNVWLGVSVEDQERFDERWPDLAMTPAAVRFISYEPALGPVDFTSAIIGRPKVDQIIVGGESGPGARPFNIEWAAQTVIQCQSGGVAAFVKQMGAAPFMPGHVFDFKDKKGGDMAEWPPELRLRQMP